MNSHSNLQKLSDEEEFGILEDLMKKNPNLFKGKIDPPKKLWKGQLEKLSDKSIAEVCSEYINKTKKESYFTDDASRVFFAWNIIKSFLEKNGKPLKEKNEKPPKEKNEKPLKEDPYKDIALFMLKYLRNERSKKQMIQDFNNLFNKQEW